MTARPRSAASRGQAKKKAAPVKKATKPKAAAVKKPAAEPSRAERIVAALKAQPKYAIPDGVLADTAQGLELEGETFRADLRAVAKRELDDWRKWLSRVEGQAAVWPNRTTRTAVIPE